jgi:Copper type II ascorbate-dependent monooxygenase, C-terminal domain/Copper type II ascorbate-dependent monooxygenase, N-terminal domain/Cytochrome C oxidase, cbb3-type, subunit III
MKAIIPILAAAATLVACGKNDSPPTTTGAVTFWQDVAPIYNDKCVKCHQTGGIGPFRLDDYASAKAEAATEALLTGNGTMPPYHIVHDGTCGSFHDEGTLTDAQKATIKSWADSGAAEGTKVTLTLPATPKLEGALDLKTPSFMPVAQGDVLAKDDEYRCFLMDAPNMTDAFLTGYDVTPGDASIVHHVLTFIVDPQATGDNGKPNAEVMKALDDASPDRLGWPCFGAAGDNVNVDGVPVTWAPGQGVVSYPAGMGVPVKATNKLVVQVHYNLADPASHGKTDSTTVHLRFANTVTRAVAFLLPDPFLDSLKKPTPDMLPAGMTNAAYKWTLRGRDLGVGAGSVDLVAVMPHMHGRGVRQFLKLGPAGALACASHLESWDFHWQEFYFYKTFPTITPDTNVEVTCEYNTSNDTSPVLPGWGTRNEMCLTVLMVALPAAGPI